MTTATLPHLDTLVQRALLAFPAEAARIQRGAAIVRTGGVRWNAAGTALVASSSVVGGAYPVGTRCPCYDATYSAPDGHCAHRWAKCLASKLYHEQEAQWLPKRYYGTYGDDAGIVAAKADGTVWFQADGTTHWLPVSLCDVVLAGMAGGVA